MQSEEADYASARSHLVLLLLQQQHAAVRTAYGADVADADRTGLRTKIERAQAELVRAVPRSNDIGESLRADVERVQQMLAPPVANPEGPDSLSDAYGQAELQLADLLPCAAWENTSGTRELLQGACKLTSDGHKTGELVHYYLAKTNGARTGTFGVDDVSPELLTLLPDTVEDRLTDRTFGRGRQSDVRFELKGLDQDAMARIIDRFAVSTTSPLTTAGRYVQTGESTSASAGTSLAEISAAYLGHLDDLNEVRLITIAQVDGEIEREQAGTGWWADVELAAAIGVPLTLFPLLALFGFRRRRSSRRIVRYFMTDSLTGLPNRYFLEKHMPAVLSGRNRTNCAFMQVGIDRLKAVNETYGHAVGDEILVRVGRICADAAGVPGQVVRLTGDEFLVALHSLPDPLADANRIAERIQKALLEPLRIGDLRIKVKVSIGIAVSRRPTTVDGLLLEAGSALLEAKATGRGQTVEYGNTNRGFIVRRLPIAFAQREIRCELQPQIDLRTGEIPAVEVLARWYPADGPRIAIPELIRTIESLGGTERLLRAMSAEAADAARELGDAFTGRFFLNVSPLDLLPFDAADRILEVLLSGGLPPDRIGIEITETEQIGDLEHAANVLSELRQHNIAIAIDDFGVGNTPLIHLTDLPIDEVKLDRSVVSGIDADRRNKSVVSAMTQVAETLSLSVVAEGIESADELDELRALGVQYGQGYLFAKPMPVADLTVFLTEWNEGGLSTRILGN